MTDAHGQPTNLNDDPTASDVHIDEYSYWIGPYGVLVPSTIDAVVSNTGKGYILGGEKCAREDFLDLQGEPTNNMTNILSAEEYKQRYATQGDHGFWYYNLLKASEHQ